MGYFGNGVIIKTWLDDQLIYVRYRGQVFIKFIFHFCFVSEEGPEKSGSDCRYYFNFKIPSTGLFLYLLLCLQMHNLDTKFDFPRMFATLKTTTNV